MAEEQNNSFIHQAGEMIGNAIQALGNQLDKLFAGIRGIERGNGLDLRLSFSSQGNSLKQRSVTGSHVNPPPPVTPRQKDPNVFPQRAQEPDKGLAAKIRRGIDRVHGPEPFIDPFQTPPSPTPAQAVHTRGGHEGPG